MHCRPTPAARATRARRRDAGGRFLSRPVRRHDEGVATRGREGNGDGEARRATRRRPRRRRAPALVFIIVGGVAAVAVTFVLARALEDERPHGSYLIGAWTFGDRGSLERAVDAGAIDEVSVDWLQSRADGSVEAPRADASFIVEARKEDCRVIVILTEYDEAIPQFDPAIPAAILATARTSTGRRSRPSNATGIRRSSRSSPGGSTGTAA